MYIRKFAPLTALTGVLFYSVTILKEVCTLDCYIELCNINIWHLLQFIYKLSVNTGILFGSRIKQNMVNLLKRLFKIII